MISPAIETASLFRDVPERIHGVYVAQDTGSSENDRQTSAAFSDKWTALEQDDVDSEGWKQFQFDWYLRCYGYADEAELAADLQRHDVIVDAGCGPGYKAAWFARLVLDSTVIAMDLSESIFRAADRYGDRPNMLFVRGDIANTPFVDNAVGLVSCDQVLHHTIDPPATAREFRRIIGDDGQLNTYVYATKALPRELLDEHLREYTKQLSAKQVWELSDQLTQLGKTLSELDVTIEVPAMPALGITGGKQDLQRFIYWNFLKCFWNPRHGFEASKMINFDWYAPSTAFRYTREEFVAMMEAAGFKDIFLHGEEACHSGRFR